MLALAVGIAQQSLYQYIQQDHIKHKRQSQSQLVQASSFLIMSLPLPSCRDPLLLEKQECSLLACLLASTVRQLQPTSRTAVSSLHCTAVKHYPQCRQAYRQCTETLTTTDRRRGACKSEHLLGGGCVHLNTTLSAFPPCLPTLVPLVQLPMPKESQHTTVGYIAMGLHTTLLQQPYSLLFKLKSVLTASLLACLHALLLLPAGRLVRPSVRPFIRRSAALKPYTVLQ